MPKRPRKTLIAILLIVIIGVAAAGGFIWWYTQRAPEEEEYVGDVEPYVEEEEYLGDVEPYVKQEGITAVWSYRHINVYVTIGNSGEAGVVTVTFQSEQGTQTKYIYLDKGKEKGISFKIYDGWYGSRYLPGEVIEYNVTASPTPAVYIQGKPGQDYIPELSNIEIVVYVSEGVKVDALFSDDKGRILAFEGIPVDVTVKVYTEKMEDYVNPQGQNCFRYVKDRQIYEKTVTIDSYKDASSRLGGEKIEIPFDVYDVKEVGFVEVIVHTSKGDFKDEVRV